MVSRRVLLLAAAALGVRGQSSSPESASSSGAASSSSTSSSVNQAFSYTQNISFITTSIPTSAFTGGRYTYITYDGQSSVATGTFLTITGSSPTTTNSRVTRTTQTQDVTDIGGATTTTNGTATSTSSSATVTNTVPCNNYPEFCNRKYSNITGVAAHNSLFSVKNNAASNQYFDMTTQLNDGIRMIQGQTHYYENDIYNCHTSCDLLNAGTFQASLETLVSWLQSNPYDVVTWLIGNDDFLDVENYTAPIENSGIRHYLYEPDYIPQHRDQWPTLGQMILSGKRVVMFMDYNADQSKVPYILDEFTHMWETPFSPTNQSFPCTVQRPPGLNETSARDEYMYLANHNLNVAISLDAILGTNSGTEILIPDTANINYTNGEYNQFGQLAAMGQNCTAKWNRPPNWLLVDYYNFGYSMPGSVFKVAAELNGVTYTQSCCGTTQSFAPTIKASMLALVAAVGFASLLIL